VCYTLTGAQDRKYLFRTAIESIMTNQSEACRWFRSQWQKAIIAQVCVLLDGKAAIKPEQNISEFSPIRKGVPFLHFFCHEALSEKNWQKNIHRN
jgi:hypothetical protein